MKAFDISGPVNSTTVKGACFGIASLVSHAIYAIFESKITVKLSASICWIGAREYFLTSPLLNWCTAMIFVIWSAVLLRTEASDCYQVQTTGLATGLARIRRAVS